MSCPISRDPALSPDDQLPGRLEDASGAMFRQALALSGVDEATGPMPAWSDSRVPAIAAARSYSSAVAPASADRRPGGQSGVDEGKQEQLASSAS